MMGSCGTVFVLARQTEPKSIRSPSLSPSSSPPAAPEPLARKALRGDTAAEVIDSGCSCCAPKRAPLLHESSGFLRAPAQRRLRRRTVWNLRTSAR